MIKRIISLIIIMIMMVLPVYAQDEVACVLEKPLGGRMGIIGESIEAEDDLIFSSFYAAQAEEKTLAETLEEGLLAHNTAIDIRRYRIPGTNAGKAELLDVLCEVIHKNYNIICFTGYGSRYSGGIITSVTPYYILSSYNEDIAARAEMDAEIERYIDLVSDVPDFVGKMLVIHDEFAKNCRYSTAELAEFNRKMKIRNEYIEKGLSLSLIPEEDKLTEEDYSIYTPFRVLTKGDAVCQGNSIALNAIYRRLAEVCGKADFDSAFCYNNGHIWNMIKLGDKWYHLDETWNDPDIITGEDSDGNYILSDKCLHEYFMVSDSVMQDHSPSEWGHYGYDGEGIVCDDTRYEDGYIFSGENEYGGWYGNIVYEDGRYKIDVFAMLQEISDDKIGYVMTGYPVFYSNTAKSHGLIASDACKVTVGGAVKNRIMLFANEDIAAGTNIRYALYENDALFDVAVNSRLNAIGQTKILDLKFSPANKFGKVFLWKNGTQEAVCEAVDIK